MEDPKFIEWGKRYVESHSPEKDVGVETVQYARAFASDAWFEGKRLGMAEVEEAKRQEAEKFKLALKDLKMPALLKDQIDDAFRQFK
jgi:hypothetical protein